MHVLFDELGDKAGNPWFSAVEKDLLINLASLELVQTRSDVFEVNERRRQDLAKMTKPYSVSSTSFINVTSITDFLRVAALQGVFTKPGCSTETITSPIPPMPFDDYVDGMRDPWEKPDDKDPFYIQFNDGTITSKIEVKSATTPLTLLMFYIKMPVTVNSQSTPKVSSDLPSYVHAEIVNIAVRKAKGILNDPSYQVQLNEIRSQEN